MKTAVIMLITAVLGTLGFSILFYIRPRHLPLACLGGLLTCGVYLVFDHLIGGDFLPNVAAAFIGAVYSEIMARKCRTPVSVFTTPSIVPLVPGSMLYRTMSSLVQSDYAAAGTAGLSTLTIALGIAAGIAGGSLIVPLCLSAVRRCTKKRHTSS